jgi:hypothetical protein
VKDHRLTYLDYEGEVSGKRGSVTAWDTGTYEAMEWTDTRIRLALAGRKLKARLVLERSPTASKAESPAWTIADATAEIRKHATALLREASPESAPTAELARIHETLLGEERKIMALVDRYARGEEIDWALASVDLELGRKIESERARWRHPWLDAARLHAQRLEKLAGLLGQQRPVRNP